jgi:hypothetical protein
MKVPAHDSLLELPPMLNVAYDSRTDDKIAKRFDRGSCVRTVLPVAVDTLNAHGMLGYRSNIVARIFLGSTMNTERTVNLVPAFGSAQRSWSSSGSTDRPITLTLHLSKFGTQTLCVAGFGGANRSEILWMRKQHRP